MAEKKLESVWVKYVPRPGMMSRIIVGDRFFDADARLHESEFGELLEMEWVEKHRDALQEAGCHVYDEKGIEFGLSGFAASLKGKGKKRARETAKDLAGAVGQANAKVGTDLATDEEAKELAELERVIAEEEKAKGKG